MKYVSVLYLAYTFILLVAAAPFVSMLNPAYLPVVSFLMPMALAYILLGFLTVLSQFASAIYMQKYAAISSGIFLAFAIVLNFYLVPHLKYLGAIGSLLASALVSFVLLMVLIWSELKSRY
jgi:O-antigen/teichoic acid export membrane protein